MAPLGWIALILCAVALYKWGDHPREGTGVRAIVVFVLLFIGFFGLVGGRAPSDLCDRFPNDERCMEVDSP